MVSDDLQALTVGLDDGLAINGRDQFGWTALDRAATCASRSGSHRLSQSLDFSTIATMRVTVVDVTVSVCVIIQSFIHLFIHSSMML